MKRFSSFLDERKELLIFFHRTTSPQQKAAIVKKITETYNCTSFKYNDNYGIFGESINTKREDIMNLVLDKDKKAKFKVKQ